MKVIVDGERVMAVSKQIPVERANGESIGMIRYNGQGALAMRDVLDRMVRQPSGKEVFYLAASRHSWIRVLRWLQWRCLKVMGRDRFSSRLGVDSHQRLGMGRTLSSTRRRISEPASSDTRWFDARGRRHEQ